MKKTLLSLALCLLGLGAMAQELTSPYTGAEPVEGGVYYLYNVKSGKWLNSGHGNYNTQLGFDETGMQVQLVKSKNGTDLGLKCIGLGDNKYWGWSKYYDNTDKYEDPFTPTKFASNGSGSYYCDQGQSACENLVFTASSAVENGYIISLRNAWGKTPHFTYAEDHQNTMHILNASDITEGYDVWLFVTYDERHNITPSVYHGAEPVDGGKYYLYNVKTGKWFATSGGRYNTAGSVADEGSEIELENYNDGFAIKTIHVGTNTYYGWIDKNGSFSLKDYFVDSGVKERFNFEHVGDNRYKIILNYNTARHLAAADGDHPVTATYEEGADLWILVSSDEYNFTSQSVEFNSAAEGYATLCLPRQTVIPTGVTAYKASAPDAENYVALTAIEGNTLPAYEAVLLKGVAGESYTFEADENAAIENFADNCFRGNSSSESVAVSSLGYDHVLTLGKSKTTDKMGFYTYTGETIGANKAYYPVTAASPVRGFAINLGGDETAIQIVNGQSSDSKCFDLQGRRVNKAQHGIYIVNGKKVVIK